MPVPTALVSTKVVTSSTPCHESPALAFFSPRRCTRNCLRRRGAWLGFLRLVRCCGSGWSRALGGFLARRFRRVSRFCCSRFRPLPPARWRFGRARVLRRWRSCSGCCPCRCRCWRRCCRSAAGLGLLVCGRLGWLGGPSSVGRAAAGFRAAALAVPARCAARLRGARLGVRFRPLARFAVAGLVPGGSRRSVGVGVLALAGLVALAPAPVVRCSCGGCGGSALVLASSGAARPWAWCAWCGACGPAPARSRWVSSSPVSPAQLSLFP